MWHVPELCKNLFGQIFSDTKEIVVDYAIFTESLSSGIFEISKLCGSTDGASGAGFYNKSPRKKGKTSDFYTATMIKKVQKKCEWEIDVFKYTVDGKSEIGRDIVELRYYLPQFPLFRNFLKDLRV